MADDDRSPEDDFQELMRQLFGGGAGDFDPEQLSRLVLGNGVRWVAFGLGAGFVGALLLGRLFSNLLFETRPWDPFTYGLVALLFLGVALAACYFPARRASATNPVDALRME